MAKVTIAILLFTVAHILIASPEPTIVDAGLAPALSRSEIRTLIISTLYADEQNYDKELLAHVVDEYLDRLSSKKQASEGSVGSVDTYFSKEAIRKEVVGFGEKMVAELLKHYGIEHDSTYAQKMRKEPETYGLTFRAYKILMSKQQ